MTLKPNYLLAFARTFLTFFALVAVYEAVVPYCQGKHIQVVDALEFAVLTGVLFGTFVAIIFTPREITWDAETISLKVLFPRSGEFDWKELEAWSPYGNGTFLLKFRDAQTYQISPCGFARKDWKAFRALLDLRFSDKKTLLWVGVTPIRFGRK